MADLEKSIIKLSITVDEAREISKISKDTMNRKFELENEQLLAIVFNTIRDAANTGDYSINGRHLPRMTKKVGSSLSHYLENLGYVVGFQNIDLGLGFIQYISWEEENEDEEDCDE